MNKKYRRTFVALATALAGLGGAPRSTTAGEWCHQKPKGEEQRACIRSCTRAGGDGQACVEQCPLGYEESCTEACEHPYPCGDEWPGGLAGPFDLKEVVHAWIPTHDDEQLEVWVGLPDLPVGVKAPVMVSISPYYNFCAPVFCNSDPNEAGWWEDPDRTGNSPRPKGSAESAGIPPIRLVKRGYAMAYVAPRGTSMSSGCQSGGGRDQQQDTVTAIEWLASQTWSNGRVGINGLSYSAYYAMIALAEAPPSLKTAVVAGVMRDWYQLYTSPQGAVKTTFPAYYTANLGLAPMTPPVWTEEQDLTSIEKNVPWLLGPGPERACKETIEIGYTEPLRMYYGGGIDRNEPYWTERRVHERLSDAKAALLNLHGTLDTIPGHAWQTDTLWYLIPQVPKRRLLGAWGHGWPNAERDPDMPNVDGPETWKDRDLESIVVSWLDFWLKGTGAVPERLDHADYQDPFSREWRGTSAWPPPDARTEALYLTESSLSATPSPGTRGFLAADQSHHRDTASDYSAGESTAWLPVCPGEPAAEPVSLLYATGILEEDVLLAGNPVLDLTIESSLPGGTFSAFLVDMHPDFGCTEDLQPTGFDWLAAGAIDLNFRHGTFQPEDFPVMTPTRVRIDLHHVGRSIPAGHRLGLILAHGNSWTASRPLFPWIDVVADASVTSSHIALPVMEGTLGGKDPQIDYPPRPFAPAGYPGP